MFKSEAENIQLVDYKWNLEGIEEKILNRYTSTANNSKLTSKKQI